MHSSSEMRYKQVSHWYHDSGQRPYERSARGVEVGPRDELPEEDGVDCAGHHRRDGPAEHRGGHAQTRHEAARRRAGVYSGMHAVFVNSFVVNFFTAV